MTKDEAIEFYNNYIKEHPELTQQQIKHIRQIQEAIRNKKEITKERQYSMTDKGKIMKKVHVSFTETYQYDLDIEVYEGETVWDAVHETDLLIDRDKKWLEAHRDIIKLECEYEYDNEED